MKVNLAGMHQAMKVCEQSNMIFSKYFQQLKFNLVHIENNSDNLSNLFIISMQHIFFPLLQYFGNQQEQFQ
jgi:hypothetical protein